MSRNTYQWMCCIAMVTSNALSFCHNYIAAGLVTAYACGCMLLASEKGDSDE